MKKNICFFLLNLMLAMMIIGFMQSCTNKIAKARDTFDKNLGEAAKYCADKFPVKEVYIKGDSILTFDTLYVGGDIVIDTVETKDTVYITVTKTLPAKVITKTVRVTDTVVKENTAMVFELTNLVKTKDAQILKITEEKNEWAKKAKQRFWLILIIIGAAGTYTFLKLKRIL
jgi:hypothetical protein